MTTGASNNAVIQVSFKLRNLRHRDLLFILLDHAVQVIMAVLRTLSLLELVTNLVYRDNLLGATLQRVHVLKSMY